ncbi:MFS transporter [Microbacterium sp. cf332]|uniref:MFS transporter n=1 Tax=Microbacterium sp. cf332 TaxID=1761804 RepID=UPI00088558AA|nr:MFS transporter [Microbacterium sp. cf332]SDQ56484.1 Fucose permease [Microbacterium sp. cf332]
MTDVLSRSVYLRWRNAVFAIFAASGLSIATWAARVPSIKADLGIENREIGLALLAMGIASILGLSASSVVIARLGTRTGMFGMLMTLSVGLAVLGLGAGFFHSYAMLVVGLALFGFGNGCLDVMMNVDGAAIETHSGKTILPLFHAFFSFGTVIGAGLGAIAAGLRISVAIHAVTMAALIVVLAVVAIASVPRRAVTDAAAADGASAAGDETGAAAGAGSGRGPGWRERLAVSLSAWREPRTYTLGIIMLGMAFAEGGANDWLALGVVEHEGGSAALGAAALTVFSVSMTVVRTFGGPLVDRFGRVATLRVLAVAATAGILLFILAPNLPLVFVGAALWGIGASLGFPLGMSAAADDPAHAAARVSAAATIGYVAFLCGPPILGFISDHIGLLPTLFILVVLVAASGLASSAAKPLPGAKVGAGRH